MPERARALAAAALGVVLASVAGACASPRPSESSCFPAPPAVLDVLEAGLTENGTLRNGALRETQRGFTFVSAELHLDEHDDRVRGDILTWVTGAVESEEFFAVDIYARESSTWPGAPLDVREDGAVESRGCVSYKAGRAEPAIGDRDELRPADESEPGF